MGLQEMLPVRGMRLSVGGRLCRAKSGVTGLAGHFFAQRGRTPSGDGWCGDIRSSSSPGRAGLPQEVSDRLAGFYNAPSSKAFSTARVRSRTPSLLRMLETWFLTVPSATLSALAISLFE